MAIVNQIILYVLQRLWSKYFYYTTFLIKNIFYEDVLLQKNTANDAKLKANNLK